MCPRAFLRMHSNALGYGAAAVGRSVGGGFAALIRRFAETFYVCGAMAGYLGYWYVDR